MLHQFRTPTLSFFLIVLYFEFCSQVNVTFFLSRYHEAGAKAKTRVLELLRDLSSDLQAKINILVFASMLLVIAKALFAHVRLVLYDFSELFNILL